MENEIVELDGQITDLKKLITRLEELNTAAQKQGEEEAKNAIFDLIQALKDQSVVVRVDAAWALGQMGVGAVDAVPALILALKDRSPSVRKSVALSLSDIGTPEAVKAAVPALILALDDFFADWLVDNDGDRKVVDALLSIGTRTSDPNCKAVGAVRPTLARAVNSESLDTRGWAKENLRVVDWFFAKHKC